MVKNQHIFACLHLPQKLYRISHKFDAILGLVVNSNLKFFKIPGIFALCTPVYNGGVIISILMVGISVSF